MKVECENCGFEGTQKVCDGCEIFFSKKKETYRYDPFRENPFRANSYSIDFDILIGSPKCDFISLQQSLV